MTDIAKRTGKQDVIPLIIDAVEKVKATGYSLLIPVKKLSKRSPDELFHANTYRYLTPKGEMDYVEVVDKNKEKNQYTISNGFGKLPLEWAVQKCEWEGNRFILRHNAHVKPIVYIDADKKSMYSLYNSNTKND